MLRNLKEIASFNYEKLRNENIILKNYIFLSLLLIAKESSHEKNNPKITRDYNELDKSADPEIILKLFSENRAVH